MGHRGYHHSCLEPAQNLGWKRPTHQSPRSHFNLAGIPRAAVCRPSGFQLGLPEVLCAFQTEHRKGTSSFVCINRSLSAKSSLRIDSASRQTLQTLHLSNRGYVRLSGAHQRPFGRYGVVESGDIKRPGQPPPLTTTVKISIYPFVLFCPGKRMAPEPSEFRDHASNLQLRFEAVCSGTRELCRLTYGSLQGSNELHVAFSRWGPR